MDRLTDRNKEIPLPCVENAIFWARVHEKLARYEDAEEVEKQTRPRTYCEKWPSGCQMCELLMCDGQRREDGDA